MPKPDGTLYPWEKAELHCAQSSYNDAVDLVKRHPNSAHIYESQEKKAFAHLMAVTARYAGCKY